MIGKINKDKNEDNVCMYEMNLTIFWREWMLVTKWIILVNWKARKNVTVFFNMCWIEFQGWLYVFIHKCVNWLLAQMVVYDPYICIIYTYMLIVVSAIRRAIAICANSNSFIYMLPSLIIILSSGLHRLCNYNKRKKKSLSVFRLVDFWASSEDLNLRYLPYIFIYLFIS